MDSKRDTTRVSLFVNTLYPRALLLFFFLNHHHGAFRDSYISVMLDASASEMSAVGTVTRGGDCSLQVKLIPIVPGSPGLRAGTLLALKAQANCKK